ncbi:hypothetical protein MKW92_036705 [Papaver armeniacum]|nr:hypothetical protein MKW92_036705 [Papaver armeniacum]
MRIKEWAKSQQINDPKNGTLNSYSLCLLVIFHLQTCEPAISPPLKDIYSGNVSKDLTEYTICTYTGRWEYKRNNDKWTKDYPLLVSFINSF